MLLVTGGAGYIGSHVTLELMRRGREVVVFDDLSRGHRDLVGKALFEEGDLKDLSRVRAVFGKYPIDGVLHFAAKSLVGESMAEPLDPPHGVSTPWGQILILTVCVHYYLYSLVALLTVL